MRCAAVFGLLVVGGCNQIFGLSKTEPAPLDAPPEVVRLEAQVALTRTDAIGPDPTLRTLPLEPPPAVWVGPLDGDLRSAPYTATGEIDVPGEIAGAPWRLAYQLPGAVPHEIQWQPAAGAGRLVVPIFGRLPRTPPPANSGYAITVRRAVTNTEYTFLDGVAYTTGIWSRVPFGQQGGPGNPVQLAASALQSLSGPPGTPEGALADLLVLADYERAGGCRTMAGSAELAAPALVADTTAAGEATLNRPERTVVITYPQATLQADARLASALGAASGTPASGLVVGRVPSLALPAFTSTLDGVPAPVLISLAECAIEPVMVNNQLQQTTDAFTDPTALAAFPAVLVTFFKNTRALGITQLASSIVGLQHEPSGADAYTSSLMEVPFATDITLGDGATTLELGGATDAQLVPADATRLELRFALETGAGGHLADYVEVGLYRIDRAVREPILERVYVAAVSATAPVVMAIEPAQLAVGVEYVFAIRTHRGRPNAGSFDFSVVGFPQAVATIFTRSFKRQ